MPEISDYRFGRIVIDGQEHSNDVIVLPDRVVAGWWRQEGHRLVIDDLAEVLDELPEQLVVGAGAQERMKPDPAVLDELRSRGHSVEVLPTPEAVRRYAQLDPATTAAALHLTC
ncbi:MAG TPA: MTH938/NDUFAF3 family protein [Egibacteraceae bacterium]|nr:MTH938/NDUFAF3 family protein [Actinomycetota bacterium]HWB72833.1 MTH938/NDUFAF3 family protein [Egibacteraceae bacterium]